MKRMTIHTGRKETKLKDDMITYVDNPKGPKSYGTNK